MLNAIMLNSDTDNISDSESISQSILDTVTLTKENLLKSPWKNETDTRSYFSSNKRDSNILGRVPIVRSNSMKKKVTTGQKVRKNLIENTTSTLENSVQRSNRSQWVKLNGSDKKKSQKYHWSGTFRTKTSLFSKDVHHSSLHLSHNSEVDKGKRQQTNYNYNYEDYGEKKGTDKGNILYSNEFHLQNYDNSRKNEQMNNINYQSYNCADKFNNHFKNYDIEQDSSSTAFPDFNINLRKKEVTFNIDNKNKNACNTDLCTNQQENTSILYSQPSYNINNINKEECVNLRNAKKYVSPSTNIEFNRRKMINDTETKSIAQSYFHKLWCFLLFFIKNIILFLLFPVIYIIFFIYVHTRDRK